MESRVNCECSHGYHTTHNDGDDDPVQQCQSVLHCEISVPRFYIASILRDDRNNEIVYISLVGISLSNQFSTLSVCVGFLEEQSFDVGIWILVGCENEEFHLV
jgi:hypothetical protein